MHRRSELAVLGRTYPFCNLFGRRGVIRLPANVVDELLEIFVLSRRGRNQYPGSDVYRDLSLDHYSKRIGHGGLPAHALAEKCSLHAERQANTLG